MSQRVCIGLAPKEGRMQSPTPPDIRSAVDNVFLLPRRWGDGDKKLLREYYRWDEEWCSDEKWANLLDECARRELCLVFNTQPEGSGGGMSDYVSVIEA